MAAVIFLTTIAIALYSGIFVGSIGFRVADRLTENRINSKQDPEERIRRDRDLQYVRILRPTARPQ